MGGPGVLVAVAVLMLGTGLGLWWRRTDGRLRSARPLPAAPATGGGPDRAAAGSGSAGPSAGSGSAGPAGARAAAGPAGARAAADPGVVHAAADPGIAHAAADPGRSGERLDAELRAQLGVHPAAATLLQFSSAVCAPCRAVRRVSAEVAALLPGVRHVEVDAESHLDAVRALGIWRTPTLLVLDADGRVVRRATGVPAKAQLIAVLEALLPAA